MYIYIDILQSKCHILGLPCFIPLSQAGLIGVATVSFERHSISHQSSKTGVRAIGHICDFKL